MANPFETLGLPSTATADEVKARWKALASQHHPDRGGDADIFNTMRQAYQDALKKASASKKCATCNGTGKVVESHGFSSIKVRCKVCNGKGKTDPSA